MKKPALAILVLILSVVPVALACGGGGEDATATPRPAATSTPMAQATQPPASSSGSGEVVNIALTENPHSFLPDGFDFKAGTTYKLTFAAPELELHTFTVDELNVDVSINVGEAVVFEFTPTQTGTFDLICIPHEALGMVGKIRVS